MLTDTATDHLAWAAGFWDGEGNVAARDNSSGGRCIKATITQKDRRALERFQRTVQMGAIYPRRKVGQWAWSLTARQNVKRLADSLWPWLDEIKRQQFDDAFRAYAALKKSEPLLHQPFSCGHSQEAANVYVQPSGYWICRTCARAAQRRFRQRLKERG